MAWRWKALAALVGMVMLGAADIGTASAQTRNARDDGPVPGAVVTTPQPAATPEPATEPETTPEPAAPARQVTTRRTPYLAPPPLPDPRFSDQGLRRPPATPAEIPPTDDGPPTPPPGAPAAGAPATIAAPPAGATPTLTPPAAGTAPVDLIPGGAPVAITPPAETAPPVPVDADPVAVTLTARLLDGGEAIPSGMSWRVYELSAEGISEDNLVLQAAGGPITTNLVPGNYMLHASYGRAFVTRPLTVVPDTPATIDIVMNAGGLLLRAAIDTETPLPPGEVRYEIRADDPERPGHRRLVVDDVGDGEVIALVEGIYHVVSRYGDANAIVRADLRVEAGQLTEAVIYHNAAEVTLKLVSEPNGEALANTTWTILTPGGDTVRDFVGAFPTLVLAEGEYTAIARHDGRIFNRDFQVVGGLNREIEVVAQ
ncbi:MAG: hypothetical protein KDI98_11010 [Hyphomicrobiaceae bacterium]|nr:hypothetical protein [Hyphomicrobiaceae bacterium]